MSSTVKKITAVRTLDSTNATERGTFNLYKKGVQIIAIIRGITSVLYYRYRYYPGTVLPVKANCLIQQIAYQIKFIKQFACTTPTPTNPSKPDIFK